MSMNTTIGRQAEPRGERELIVITKSDAHVRVEGDRLASPAGASVADIQSILDAEGARMEPLFGGDVGEAETLMPDAEVPGEGFGAFFRVHAPENRLEALAAQLRQLETVDGAYVKPPAEPAHLVLDRRNLMIEVEPAIGEAPTTSPLFTDRQDYLDAAPVGVDAAYAWSQAGGRGQNIRVIDCEWGWLFSHEDLVVNSLGLIAGSNHSSTNHGTAVHGEIGGDENAFGVTGISPAAGLGSSSFFGQVESTAIKAAADTLSAGDIILLEIHRPGPNAKGIEFQQGYVGIEWWPDDFVAIRYAVSKGIIVVEAAGNGWENLDAAIYNTPLVGFPSWWTNPFNVANPSSQAVLAGAGDPPYGTHGRTNPPSSKWGHLTYTDRARCGFSNWGARVDAQGWGWEVTTTGYGDLQGGADPNRWYTDQFSGTSSASPIVVAALASTQGVLKAKGMPLMTSQGARDLLRITGSPQQAATDRPVSQRVGNRPNLRQLIPAALRQWIYNATIQYTYAVTTTQSAWVYIKDLGWRLIATGAPDGVTNVFGVACEAQAAGKPAHVYIDDTRLYNIWLP
jgi:hypothetical protein